MSSRPFVKASGNNILDISGQLNIKSGHGSTDNSGIRFYGNDIRIDGVIKNYSNNFIGITADASGEDIMYHLPYDGAGNTLKDISDCNIIATQCYVNKNASKAVNNRGQSFFEIMTEQPEMFTLENSSNNGNITIEWHYNDIIPIIDVFPCNLLLAAKKSTYKDKQLPYIDKIYIDISGSVNDVPGGESGSASSNDSNKWLRHDVINISDNGYNQNADKTFIFNKTALSNIYQSSILNIFGKDTSANSFDVRVYGENFADKGNPNCPFPDPTDDSTFSNVYPKALIITDLFFPGAKPPSKPQRDSESVTFNSINLRFFVSRTENGVVNSNARIVKSKSEYNGIETLSSILYPISDISLNTGDILQNNVGEGVINTFPMVLSNVKSGSKYKYKVAAMNNLISSYSEFSDIFTSVFTKMPSPNAQTSAINFSYAKTANVTNKSFVNRNIIYINIADNQNIRPSVSSNQNFEITKRNALVTDDTYEGFGKYVDGSKNLVTINMKIGGNPRNQILYHGFGLSDANDISFNNSVIAGLSDTLSNNAYLTYSQNDIGTNNNDKGFRINGNIQLKTISNGNVQTYIGGPSKNVITLRYEYLRDSKVSGNNTYFDNEIYIDNLSSSPNITSNTIVVNVTNVQYLMGIPSVRTFSINFTRDYTNINSIYEYIPGNRKIGRIENIQNTSFTTSNIYIEQSEINTTGIYTKNEDFTNKKYTSSTISSSSLINQNFTIQEKIYSLKDTTSISNDIIVKHYCDLNSFNVSSLVFSPKINYSGVKLIYEIRDITSLSNIKNINLDSYTESHDNIIEPHTLLYFDGAFRSNNNKSYPNVNNFKYNPITITNKYNLGSSAYNLSGVSDNAGYKWIGFKAAFSGSDKTTEWTAGKTSNFAGSSNDYISSEGSVFYFDFKRYLNYYGFNNTIINKLMDSTDNEVIGFIKQVNAPSNTLFLTCIGNLSMDLNPTSTWMTSVVSDNTSLDNIFNGSIRSKHGCLKALPSGVKVVQLSEDLANKGSGIDLFIGFKNTANVSSDNSS